MFVSRVRLNGTAAMCRRSVVALSVLDTAGNVQARRSKPPATLNQGIHEQWANIYKNWCSVLTLSLEPRLRLLLLRRHVAVSASPKSKQGIGPRCSGRRLGMSVLSLLAFLEHLPMQIGN